MQTTGRAAATVWLLFDQLATKRYETQTSCGVIWQKGTSVLTADGSGIERAYGKALPTLRRNSGSTSASNHPLRFNQILLRGLGCGSGIS